MCLLSLGCKGLLAAICSFVEQHCMSAQMGTPTWTAKDGGKDSMLLQRGLLQRHRLLRGLLHR
jgi:hypothetical protein